VLFRHSERRRHEGQDGQVRVGPFREADRSRGIACAEDLLPLRRVAMLRLLFEFRALVLELAGCRVFEDLSAICPWGSYGVPW
jgi:hypothetical protein